MNASACIGRTVGLVLSVVLVWPGAARSEAAAQADAIRAQVINDFQLASTGAFADPAQEQKDLDIRRTRALAALDAESGACYQRFAVNDCLAKVQARRRATLGELTRQQNVLDDDQRKERSQRAWQAQQRRSEERAASAPAGVPADAGDPFADHDDAQATKVRPKPSGPERPQPRASDANIYTPEQIARNRALYAQRLADQAAHRAQVQQRLASQPERPALPSPSESAP